MNFYENNDSRYTWVQYSGYACTQMGRKNNSSVFLVIFTKINFLVGINQIMLLVALCCVMSRLWAMSLSYPLYRCTRLPPVPLHSATPCTAALGYPLYRCTRLPPVLLHSALSVFISDVTGYWTIWHYYDVLNILWHYMELQCFMYIM